MEKESGEWTDGVDEEEVLTPTSAPQEEDVDRESEENDGSSIEAGADSEHPDKEGENDDSFTEVGADPEEEGQKELGEDGLENGEETLPDGEKALPGENGELLESDALLETVVSTPQITADEIKEAFYGALEEFFTEETVLSVAVQEEEKGLDTPLEELGLTDALLFAVLLVLLGRAVCDIIGGKNRWRK